MTPGRLILFVAALFLAVAQAPVIGGPGHKPDAPLMLDLSPYFWERFVTAERTNQSFSTIWGRQMIDGVPFQVDGRACLYGKELATEANLTRTNYPDILGVKVGRAFDELHLLHATQWSDVEGRTVALIRLNYADGTRHEFPIGYGVHVRDWQRLQSEEKELLTDTNSKVIWRGPGIPHFKSTQRMFKSVFVNPFPEKIVTTLDFVSTGEIASYDVVAATVANQDPDRPVTPAVPIGEPERDFKSALRVRVEDEAGKPMRGVWIYPSIGVPGTAWATSATPFYTAANGEGHVRYPADNSSCIVITARHEGWKTVQEFLSFTTNGTLNCGVVMVIRLASDPAALLAANGTDGGPSSNTTAATTSGSGVIASSSQASPSAGSGLSTAAGTTATGGSRPHVILMIGFPAGSNVRVEFSDRLSPPDWQPLTTLTNLPFSPFPFDCGAVDPTRQQRFYQATLLP